MAITTVFDDIVFIEGGNDSAITGEAVKIDLKFRLGAQLKNLNDVKFEMVKKAKAGGYNAILNFKYGQKSRLFTIDYIAFWGTGTLSKLPDEEYMRICRSANQEHTYQ